MRLVVSFDGASLCATCAILWQKLSFFVIRQFHFCNFRFVDLQYLLCHSQRVLNFATKVKPHSAIKRQSGVLLRYFYTI